MRPPDRLGRRGQPIAVLAMLLVSWIGARMMIIGDTGPKPAIAHSTVLQQFRSLPAAAPALSDDADLSGAGPPATAVATMVQTSGPQTGILPAADQSAIGPRERLPAPAPIVPTLASPVVPIAVPAPAPIRPLAPTSTSPPAYSPQIAAGHQLLWMAALAQVSAPDPAQRRAPDPAAPRHCARGCWSADGWLMLRRGGLGINLPGAGLPGAGLPSGTYGASQAGAVIRYRLAPSSPLRPAVYLRATSALAQRRSEELAAGLSLRPLPRLPVAAMVEARLAQTQTGAIVRPAAALVSEFPPLDLPLGLRAEAYVQAGYVGGRYATAFVDGQARLDRHVIRAGRIELRAGAGGWGGAQRGAQRLDLGPTAILAVPLGPVGARISADWRFRIAGRAAPASGPALTLSAGF